LKDFQTKFEELKLLKTEFEGNFEKSLGNTVTFTQKSLQFSSFTQYTRSLLQFLPQPSSFSFITSRQLHQPTRQLHSSYSNILQLHHRTSPSIFSSPFPNAHCFSHLAFHSHRIFTQLIPKRRKLLYRMSATHLFAFT
jgi:hypothetical protein